MEFKNLFVVAVAAGLMAGCATTPVVKESPTFEPVVAAGAKDPNPFADYGPAMQSSAEFPLTVNWQDAHKGEIAAATSPETLLSLLRKDNGEGLLNELRDPYRTDPIVMQQIAATTQVVMDPATPDAADLRARWTKTLLDMVWGSKNEYQVMFCLDQLRWCARPEDAKRLRGIATEWEKRTYQQTKLKPNMYRFDPLPQTEQQKEDTRHVREFAAQVEREVAR